MLEHDVSPLGRRLTMLIGLSVLAILFAGLMLSVYRNAMFEQMLQGLTDSNNRLRRAIADSRVKLDYYRSRQYKDKAAKEYLNRLNIGEKAIIIAERTKDESISSEEPDLRGLREAAYREYLRRVPIVEHWKLYLLDREKLEELRSAFF
jgi:hypothetical protein